MRIKGITYDTGFINAGIYTKQKFEPDIIKREMHIIRNNLHCNALRITGGDANRLKIVAQLAAEEKLEVWYSPFTCDLTQDELFNFLVNAAEQAEEIRRKGSEVVFLTGSEISLFNKGFFSGSTLNDRLELFKDPTKFREQIPQVQKSIKEFLVKLVKLIREKFNGKISYASLPFEGVDWNLFDFIATDAGYRSADTAEYFKQGIQTLVNQGKPVIITEFGCTTYRGAADKGAHGDMIIKWVDGRPKQLSNIYTRDEKEQASYIIELLDIFGAVKVDGAFVNTFSRYDLPYEENPLEDLDIASYGIVKVYKDKLGATYPDMPWEPKLAFKALAEYYNT